MNAAGNRITLILEHSPDEGMLSLICPDTGRPLSVVVEDLRSLLEERDVALVFSETIGIPSPGRSRRLLIDDTPIEEIVPPRTRSSPCACCPFSGNETAECGECENEAFWEDFPESVVRLAVLKVAGMKK
jgi:hypothetical protein